MNTFPFMMSQLLQACKANGSLQTETQTYEKEFAKHGYLCFAGGFAASTLKTAAINHDPDHYPYGICWSMPQRTEMSHGYATEQSSSSGTQMVQRTVPDAIWDDTPSTPTRSVQQRQKPLTTQGASPETTLPALVDYTPRVAAASSPALPEPLPPSNCCQY